MKYLIMAILFIGTAYGQTVGGYIDTNYDSVRIVWTYPKYDTSRWYYSPQNPKKQEQKLAEHWENYKKSLDSTFKHCLMTEIENRQRMETKQYSVHQYEDYVMVTSNGKYPVFIDRKKPTLDGFMKYLRELK